MYTCMYIHKVYMCTFTCVHICTHLFILFVYHCMCIDSKIPDLSWSPFYDCPSKLTRIQFNHDRQVISSWRHIEGDIYVYIHVHENSQTHLYTYVLLEFICIYIYIETYIYICIGRKRCVSRCPWLELSLRSRASLCRARNWSQLAWTSW